MVENVVYSFSSAVSLSTTNFALTGIKGTPNSLVPGVVLTPSNGNTVWTVTFTGTGVNTATNSIGDGEYDLALSGLPGQTTSHYDFFRLLGDMDGNGVVDSAGFVDAGRNVPASHKRSALPGRGRPRRQRHLIDSADFSQFTSRTSCTRCRTRPN